MATPTDAYLVIVIDRAPSSGSENRCQKVFYSLEGASAWLINQHEAFAEDYNYPEEWDEEDMGCAFPGKEIFSIENLKENLEKNKKTYYDKPIWGPYSQYCCHAPTEYFIKGIKIEP